MGGEAQMFEALRHKMESSVDTLYLNQYML